MWDPEWSYSKAVAGSNPGNVTELNVLVLLGREAGLTLYLSTVM